MRTKKNVFQFEDESLNPNAPIKNTKAKGKDTTGMVSFKLDDGHNTIIFCESKQEIERVRQLYKENSERFNTVSIKNHWKTKKKEREDEIGKIIPIDEIGDIADEEDE